MPNINNVIRKHISKIMKNPAPSTTKTCNYLSECLIYKASVSTTTNKYYYGTCENTFKEHYSNYKCSFRSKSLEKKCWIAEVCIGIEREIDINHFLNWDIDMKLLEYVSGSPDVIYVFLRSSFLQELILIFYSINMMSLSQNTSIEINLLWIASKIDRIIYTIQCI